MKNNNQKFRDKWGYDPDTANQIKVDFISLINRTSNMSFRVLEIGCGCGGTLLSIKEKFPQAELFGVESNSNAAEVAEIVASIERGSVYEASQKFPALLFDYIFINDPIYYWSADEGILTEFRKKLKEDGVLIAACPNLIHYSTIKNMLQGTIKRNHLVGMTFGEVQSFFEAAFFPEVRITGTVGQSTASEKDFMHSLSKISGVGSIKLYEIHEFLVEAKNMDSEVKLKQIINHLVMQTELDHNLKELSQYSSERIISVIEKVGYDQKVELFNYLAIQYLEKNDAKQALTYLNFAFEENDEHPATLFNLGLTMYTMGHLELALNWLELLPEKSEQVQHWLQEIRSQCLTT
nr:methyltransferase domain-containing protein [Paenibacillus alba]